MALPLFGLLAGLAAGLAFQTFGHGDAAREGLSPAAPRTPWDAGWLVWSEPLVADTGLVCAGTKIRRVVTFTHRGPEALQIARLEPDCSCSELRTTRQHIKPGESFELHFEVSTSDKVSYMERLRSEARVYFAGYDVPLVLGIRATVYRPLPAVIDLGDVELGTIVDQVFVARPCAQDAWVLRCTDVEGSGLSVEIPSRTDREVPVRVILDSGAAGPGKFMGLLRFEGASIAGTGEVVHVRATVLPRIVAEPDIISLGVVNPQSHVRRTIELVSRSGRGFRVVDTMVSLADVRTESDATNEAAPRHRITLWFDVPRSPGEVEGVLVVLTDDPEQPRVEVPIYGLVR